MLFGLPPWELMFFLPSPLFLGPAAEAQTRTQTMKTGLYGT